MAKKFTHKACGRTFRTAHGKATHVRCEPTPAPAPTQEADAAKTLLVELRDAIMLENGGKFVNADIRARKLVATLG